MEASLRVLGDLEKPLQSRVLLDLSRLSPDEVRLLERAWSSIPPGRWSEILERLNELAEDDVELDFEDVFRLGLKDLAPEVRIKAIKGLWECEDRSLIEPLVALLRGDGSEAVRAAAATALGHFVLQAEFDKLRPKDASRVEEALVEVLRDRGEGQEVRRRALEALGPLSEEWVKDLIREAYNSDNLKMRVSALHAMGLNCDPIWLPALLREVCNPEPEMRYEAATACGELEEEEAVPYLLPLLRDPDEEVRLSAIEALGHIGGGLAKEKLQECLQDPQEHIREAAMAALDELCIEEEPLGFFPSGSA